LWTDDTGATVSSRYTYLGNWIDYKQIDYPGTGDVTHDGSTDFF
jgi:hypothetical protein